MTLVGRTRPRGRNGTLKPIDAAKPVGAQERGVPGHRRAPIVAGDDRLVDPERIEESDHVADEVKERVLFDLFRTLGLP